jgi:transposase
VLRRRHDGVDLTTAARSWTAQRRLCGRFRRLAARKNSRSIVIVAIARGPAGFL